MQTVKAYLVEMPGEALVTTTYGKLIFFNGVVISSTTGSYSRSLTKTATRLEALLKVIVTPVVCHWILAWILAWFQKKRKKLTVETPLRILRKDLS